MKARKYDRKILQKGIVPNVYAIQESGNITDSIIEFIQKHDEKIVNDVIYLKEIFESGKEFGSLIQVKNIDFNNLRTSLNEIIDNSKSTLTDINITNIISNDLMALINQAELLSKKYSAVVTNPPYMNKFEKNLKDFAKKYYKDYSKDLFSMFIYRNFGFCIKDGYCGFLTPFNWMFIKNHEQLRKYIITNKCLSSLIQLEYNSFTEIAMVPVGTFILYNSSFKNVNYIGTYLKLSEFKGNMDVQKEKVVNSLKSSTNYKFNISQNNFLKTPNYQIIFWEDKYLIDSFNKYPPLSKYAKPSRGLSTFNDNKFLRFWFEPTFKSINFNCSTLEDSINSKKKWFPYNKGGSYRKWYGNNEYVVNFYNFGEDIKQTGKGSFSNSDYYFSKGLTWSRISSRYFGVRYHDNGFIIGDAGPSVIVINDNYIFYMLGILLSQFSLRIISSLNESMTFQVGDLNRIPILVKEEKKKEIEELVKLNIEISKKDWDENEISWDYIKHFSLKSNSNNLKDIYGEYVNFKENEFIKMKNNEIKLNKIIYNLYNITEEFEIKDDDITLNKMNKTDFIKSFISYAIGCMFGRYSLDNEGLQFAGGEFNINNYNKFIPDDDNIIPVLDTAYFDDDIVRYFTKFVETCFGKKTLEENLDFIAGALSKSKKPSREIIRQYLLKNFFNDHKRTYKKCPIYWQFSSGKHNGFNCLVYMHRYEPSLVARIRTDYLHKTQKAIEQRIANNDNIINNSTSKQEVANATKEKAKLQKQLKETQEYDEVLAHIANQNIEIDLDDGVKVNYAKFQNIEIKKEGSKTKKVNLLKKI